MFGNIRAKRYFSLVELMVVIGLFSFFIVILTQFLLKATELWRYTENETELNVKSQQIFATISNLLAEAVIPATIPKADEEAKGFAITLQNERNSSTNYALSPQDYEYDPDNPTTTNDIYDESIDGYEGTMATVEDLSMQIPEDIAEMQEEMEIPEEAPSIPEGDGSAASAGGSSFGIPASTQQTSTGSSSGGGSSFGVPVQNQQTAAAPTGSSSFGVPVQNQQTAAAPTGGSSFQQFWSSCSESTERSSTNRRQQQLWNPCSESTERSSSDRRIWYRRTNATVLCGSAK